MLRRKVYATRGEKLLDLIIGVGVTILAAVTAAAINWGLNTLVARLSPSGAGLPVSTLVLLALPTLADIGLMVVFAFTRRWIALGMLASFAVLGVPVLCLAVVLEGPAALAHTCGILPGQ